MTSIRIKVNDYKGVIKSKLLVEIIERVVSSHPLSYVNLERLRKEVDKLNELFWIKDNEGNFLLVNERFASDFHMTPYQIEGKNVDKFIPAYMMNFNKALEEYIQESGSVFIIEGFPLSGAPVGNNYQIIEIPVRNTEGNLSAIIGIGQEIIKEKQSFGLYESVQLFGKLLKNYLLIDDENNIKEVSEEFCRTFSLNAEQLPGKKYNSSVSGIPVIISKMTDDFIGSDKKNKSVKVNIPEIPGAEFNLHFIKGREDEILLLAEPVSPGKESQTPVDSDLHLYDFYLQNISGPAFIYDKEDLRFLEVNDYALKLYGYRRDEFLQMDLTDLYAPEDIQSLLESPDDNLVSKPHRQRRKNGENIFVEVKKKLINYKNTQSFLYTIKDVTRKLKLEKDKQFFDTTFSNTGDLIFITDKEGFINSVSNSVRELLGYSNKNLLETSFMTLLVDEDRGKINSSVFQGGAREKLAFDTFVKKAGNELLKARLTANPVFDYKGEVEFYNIIITPGHVKEVIKEVEIESDQKGLALSAVPEINFLSGIFHDLLTPINVIIGFVQDLTENLEQPSAEQKESLGIINQNKEDLLELIKQIMEFLQTEKGQVELRKEKVKIIDIIEELKLEIDVKNLVDNVELAFGKISSSLEIVTDREKMLQCFKLLVNFIFKITGEKKLFISSSTVDEQNFAVYIRDNYNIPSPEFSGRITGLFSDSSINIKIPGFPSFYIKHLKNLLNLLNGGLETSTETAEADVLFIFPLELKEEISEEKFMDEEKIITDSVKIETSKETETGYSKSDLGIEAASDMEITETKEPSVELSRLSCLYIEDNPDSQMLFSMQMQDIKELKFAVSLEQSVPLLKNNNFDFIIIDINLQGDFNGLDILKVIRTLPDYENIPVIAVTAYYLSADKEIYIQAGFTDFISKPLLRENLMNSLEKVLIPQE